MFFWLRSEKLVRWPVGISGDPLILSAYFAIQIFLIFLRVSPVAIYTFQGWLFSHDGVRCAVRTISFSTSTGISVSLKHLTECLLFTTSLICQSAYDTDILDLDSAARALDQMKKDIIFYKRAYEENSQEPMWHYMLEYFVTRYTQLAISITHNDILDPRIKYSIRLYCYGTLGMTRESVLDDNITPARTAAAMMYDAMPESPKNIYFKKKEKSY